MSNKYCNLPGGEKISETFGQINDGFASVETDKDELQSQINNHIDSNSAHNAENITFESERPTLIDIDDTKEAIEKIDQRVDELVNNPDPNKDLELVDLRNSNIYGVFPTAKARSDNTDNLFSSHVADVATQINSLDAQLADVATQINTLDAKKAEQTSLNAEITNRINAVSAEKTERQTEIAVERARINSFTNLAEGSTTGDAELIDGRIGFDGVTYANIGSAIRTQIGNISSKVNETYSDLKSRNDYFIDGATLGEIHKVMFNTGVLKLEIYCKKKVSKFALSRMYIRVDEDVRNLSFNYLMEDGITVGTIIYRVNGDQTGVTTENISIENDDIYLFMVVDWSKISTVRETGERNYNETGIKDKYSISADEYAFLKKVHEQVIQIDADTISTELIVCGADATPYQLSVGNAMAQLGYGYVCGVSELDEGVNGFIDSFMDTGATIKFYGTIRTSGGVHKHPKHNLIGYDCTLKMGDNLGTNYRACIFPTSGGVDFATQQVISHNHTSVKGFTLDGNCENNKIGDTYSYKSIYGAVISNGIYNEEVSPYSQTQLASDIVIEDITAINTMRGIVLGIGWIGRNLRIGDAVTDHALYLAGADQAIVENVYITGFQLKGAVAISSQSWDSNRRVRNVRLRNIMLDECSATDGPYLDIRGHFSSTGNNQTLEDVFIDGFFIKKHNVVSSVIGVTIGTSGANEINTDYSLRDYPTNIHIKNFVADIDLGNTLFLINNANVILENPSIRLQNYRYDRGLFRLQSRDILKKVFNFKGMRISFDGVENSNPYTLFEFDQSLLSHSQINGLNLDDLIVEGISNYYLFGLIGSVFTNTVTVKNISAERVIANPLGKIKPDAVDYITLVGSDYYVI